MNFSEYQIESEKINQYPDEEKLTAMMLGLAGETGEVLDKYKKYLRGDLDWLEDNKRIEFRSQMSDELGNVLWYIANLATEFNLDLAFIAARNLAKLQSRDERNVIKSNGDN